MIKKCALGLILIALLFCAACGSTEKTDAPEAAPTTATTPATAAQWLDLLVRNVPFDDTMTSVPEQAASVYGILDEDGYTGDCALYISTMATPEEIAVFRADAVFSTDDLMTLALARLARQKESYADYAPAEVPKIDTAVVKTCGDFVIVCVCADNAKAEALLDVYA
jgi:hypothetical protein